MLRLQDPPIVPEDTCRVARDVSKGTLCLRIADALGPVYQGNQFTALFPRRGPPAHADAGIDSRLRHPAAAPGFTWRRSA